MNKIILSVIGGAVLAGITGCATKAEKTEAAYVSDAKIIVSPFDWGPGVDKILLSMSGDVDTAYLSNLQKESARVVTNGKEREVESVVLATETGKTDSKIKKSSYLLISLKTTFENSGSPFVYDFQKTMQNDWAKTYPVEVKFENSCGIEVDAINKRICSATALFGEQKEFSGTYTNPLTKESDNLTLRYKAYEPESLKKDGAKNPLIIWLHGQGEGGKDVDVAILGNKVSSLALPAIQEQFTTKGGKNGSYVLVPQCETYWMDGGDGTNSSGELVSRYTEILMDTIKSYVASNPDVDTNRIYLGGCSNGGYMTVNMLVEYPDYWAAAYPNCEAYAFNMYARDENGKYILESTGNAMGGANVIKKTSNRFMTEEKIEKIKHIPIWFMHSANDTVVPPSDFSLPTYRELVRTGAENVQYSYFESVKGVDDVNVEFFGHWVWVYLFNNQVTAVQDTKLHSVSGEDTFVFVPTNAGGGTLKAHDKNGEYNTVFEWLNAQSK